MVYEFKYSHYRILELFGFMALTFMVFWGANSIEVLRWMQHGVVIFWILIIAGALASLCTAAGLSERNGNMTLHKSHIELVTKNKNYSIPYRDIQAVYHHYAWYIVLKDKTEIRLYPSFLLFFRKCRLSEAMEHLQRRVK